MRRLGHCVLFYWNRKEVSRVIVKAVQQIMLGKITRTEKETFATLETYKFAGYDGIELNGFMIRPTGILVRALTAAAGMPAGRGGAYDWAALTREAGLKVVSLHEDLGTLKADPEAVAQRAAELGTDKVVATGMYRFDYTDRTALAGLCADLNRCGARLHAAGMELLYHNHYVELCWLSEGGERSYEYILRETDPEVVNFEFDSYWFAEAGADAAEWMERLGGRMRLWHINDRGSRQRGPSMTPILKCDSMELGCGNMNLARLTQQAKANGIQAVVLESHRNHVEHSAIKSIQCSAAYLNQNF